MIWFDDPRNPEDQCKCTVQEFADRIAALKSMFENPILASLLVCGKTAAMKYIAEAEELIKEAGGQLHVGLPVEVIADVERERTPTTVASGFGDSKFEQRQSGLIIPRG
jgi:hypothetical protein